MKLNVTLRFIWSPAFLNLKPQVTEQMREKTVYERAW